MTTTDRLRILVVEDEALVAMDLEDILSHLGHDVVATAGSAEQAIAILDDMDQPPDKAIVDANLGGHSARPVIDALRRLGVGIVMASGYGKAELARLGFHSPSINKPYSARDVKIALSTPG
jgi:DNA-binding response OmpR family regulator